MKKLAKQTVGVPSCAYRVRKSHRHLREIDCSSAIVGGPALALNPGANQYTGPTCGIKKFFIAAAVAGNITTTVNKDRRAEPVSSLLLLDVYGKSLGW